MFRPAILRLENRRHSMKAADAQPTIDNFVHNCAEPREYVLGHWLLNLAMTVAARVVWRGGTISRRVSDRADTIPRRV